MRRSAMALLGLITATTMMLVPAAAQAAAVAHGSSGPAAVHTMDRNFTLSAPACDALRRSLHGKLANCSAQERFRVVRARPAAGHSPSATAAGNYYQGYGTVCGGAPGGACQSWWVDLHFAFTVSGQQAWDNGSWCQAGGTNITWCGHTGNGSNLLSIGANFDPAGSGYVRLNIFPGQFLIGDIILPDGDGTYETGWNSWVNSGGWCLLPAGNC